MPLYLPHRFETSLLLAQLFHLLCSISSLLPYDTFLLIPSDLFILSPVFLCPFFFMKKKNLKVQSTINEIFITINSQLFTTFSLFLKIILERKYNEPHIHNAQLYIL